MPTRSLALAAVLLGASSALADGPGLGRPLSPDEIPSYATYILPDGAGLPVGMGSVARGRDLYAEQCAACHGETGTEGPITPLVAPDVTSSAANSSQAAGAYWPYATTLFDYVRRAMPFQNPKSLADDDVYAITAFLLFQNGIIEEDVILDEASLPSVVMPNRDGFIDLWALQGDEPY